MTATRARLAVILVVLLGLVAESARADSVGYQGDPARSGNVAVPGLAPPLTTAWTAKLRGTVSAPVVVGGTVYVTQPSPGDADRLTGSDVELVALDAATGSGRWTRTIPARLGQGNVAYVGGHLVVSVDAGTLTAFGLDGTVAWSYRTGANAAQLPGDLDGDVLVSSGSGSNPLIAVSPGGEERWRSDTFGVFAPPTADHRAFAGRSCGAVSAFTTSGAGAWSYPGSCSGPAAPASVSDGRVWTSDGNGRGSVVDANTGALIRAFAGISMPAFGAGLAVSWAGDYRYPRSVQVEDAATGAVAWRWTPPDQDSDVVRLAPFIVGDTVYVVHGGRVWARDLRTGDPRQELALDGAPDGTHVYGGMPGVAAGRGLLLVPTRGVLTALRSAGSLPVPKPSSPSAAPAPSHAPAPAPAPAIEQPLVLRLHAPARISRHRLRHRGVRLKVTLPAGVGHATVRAVQHRRTIASRKVAGRAFRLRVRKRLRGRVLHIVVSASGVPTVRRALRIRSG